MEKIVNVVGGGLAGVEVCYQLAKRGIRVRLFEQKPNKKSPAHKSDLLAELVCSNSLRSNDAFNAVGLLKKEMEVLDSLVMKIAKETAVPAGKALAVDRQQFSQLITDFIYNHPLIEVIHQEVVDLTMPNLIIATGPLTSDDLSKSIQDFCGEEYLSFYDAAAPIVSADSIDYNHTFSGSRYGHGDDYINCPLTKEQYLEFYHFLLQAKEVELKDFEQNMFFEGCMPIEEMARRGEDVLRFGPMKPVGLSNDKDVYAVVQLRIDDARKTMYNIVGFQTHLKFPDQKKLLSIIPALRNCEILRYGVMHRNTFINSPKILDHTYQTLKRKDLFFAGQITGVEGYVESAASGLLAAIRMAQFINGEDLTFFDSKSMIFAMANYVSNPAISNLQPMNANYSLLDYIKADKKIKKELYYRRSMEYLDEIKSKLL